MGLKLANIFSQDLDDLFAYNTAICVILRSRGLGICYRFFQLMALIYITVIVYIFEQGYHKIETNSGISVIHSSAAGQSVVNSDSQGIWDSLDIENAHLEGNTIFVSTKTVQHLAQQKGNCKDFYRSCLTDTDCYTFINETCESGRCSGPNWCNQDGMTEIVEFDDALDHFLIWLRGYVKFYTLSEEGNEFTTFTDKKTIFYPANNANTYSLRNLLELGSISYREIKEEGAEILVDVVWDCLIGESCTPKLQVKRVDKFTDNDYLGSYNVRYYYYMNGNSLLRNTFNQTGMKFYFDTKAKGRTFSYERVLLELATLFSLWRVLDMFMDLVILWVPGNHEYLQKKYMPVEDEEEEEIIEAKVVGPRRSSSAGDGLDESQELLNQDAHEPRMT